jgi:hypothetical protein
MDYMIDDIPASYIVKDTVLTENELALFDVNQRDVDYLFGYMALRVDYNIDMVDINNSIDNIQLLCPNCHSYTDNYRGKNIQKMVDIKPDIK